MGLPPLSYHLRSLFVRRSSTLLTVVGIGATVAVLAGVLALQQGFASLYVQGGREDVVVFLRQGSTNESDSGFRLESAEYLKKTIPEIAQDADGVPLASGELYLAVRRRKLDGGETNVPIRGVEPQTLAISGEAMEIVEGRAFEPGSDEVVVGEALTGRIRGCEVGEVIQLNTIPFRVVGVFRHQGPLDSELWGDADRIAAALQRGGFSRVIARVEPGTDVAELAERMDEDTQVPCKVLTEQEYLAGQTAAVSVTLGLLGTFLALVMGTAAVFTGTNTMLSALAARSSEIGILLSIGFRPLPVFLGFMFEAACLGLVGGVIGCLMVLPIHGVSTGTTNFQTFTEVAFSFQVTPTVLGVSVGFAVFLGLLGGAWPAWRAARLRPTQALRRE